MATENKKPEVLRTSDHWYAEYHVDDEYKPAGAGGIVLNNVRHRKFPLAADIRVKGFWIEFKRFTKGKKGFEVIPKYFPLNPIVFKYSKIDLLNYEEERFKKEHEPLTNYGLTPRPIYKIANGEVTDLSTIIKEVHQFEVYSYLNGLQAEFKLNPEQLTLNGDNNLDVSGLIITQTFLFSRYSNDPSHEASGALRAARFFPLIRFAFTQQNIDATKNVYYTTESIRADYHFEYNLSAFIDPGNLILDEHADNMQLLSLGKATKGELWYMFRNKPQQAALFADANQLSANGLFASVEKPIIYEIVGSGLQKEYQTTTVKHSVAPNTPIDIFPTFWDNIHWWGGYKNHHMISAPGGMHCCHMHWRWAEHLQNPSFLETIAIPDAGKKQYKSADTVNSKLKGELIDPAIPIQSLEFAIVKKDISPVNAINDITYSNEAYFKAQRKLFTKRTAEENARIRESKKAPLPEDPVNVRDGSNLVLNLFLTSHEIKKYPKGTFCIHGLYFAHEREVTLTRRTIIAYAGGDDDPRYENPDKNNVKREWLRNPTYK